MEINIRFVNRDEAPLADKYEFVRNVFVTSDAELDELRAAWAAHKALLSSGEAS